VGAICSSIMVCLNAALGSCNTSQDWYHYGTVAFIRFIWQPGAAAQAPIIKERVGAMGWGGEWWDIYAVQLGYNVMKGTKYFVSL
jgi:hypothetical protein